MELAGKVAIVTGAANGIGKACAAAFAREGAKVVVADLHGDTTKTAADEIGALAVTCNVAVEADIQHLVTETERALGPVDVFFSNAGIGVHGGLDAPDEEWERIWKVNTMAHVYAARTVLPSMLDRGEGYIVSTASAAGLLTQIGNASYSVTKHAAVALAEWIAITYGDRGIRASCLCPQGVNTNMLRGSASSIDRASASAVRAGGDVLEPEQVADVVVQAIRDETFLILPHPEVLTYLQRKTSDYDRWLGGMRRLQARVRSDS